MVTRSGERWTRRVRALAGLLALGSLWGAPSSAREQDLPTPADLVAKYVAAIGGADAIRAVTSFRATGKTEAPAQNMRGTFEMLGARPAKSVMRMEMDGIGKAETGFNGALGWSLDPMVGPSLLTGRLLEELKADSHIDAALYPPDLVKSMTTTARVTFDGRAAFKMHVVLVSGRQRDDYFDVATGFLIGTEGETETPMGPLQMTMILRDYKAFGPQMHPSRMVQVAMGMEQHFVVETYEYNSVKPEAFDPPAIIRAIIRSEPPAAWRPAALASFDEAWATINESFYDPTFGGLDWKGVRDELRPKVENATTHAVARATIVEMLARLKRSHFVLLSSVAAADAPPPPAGNATIGIDVRVLGADVVITHVAEASTAKSSGLAAGQVLLAVDDQAATTWWRRDAEGVDARVAAFDVWQRAERSLRGATGTPAVLRVRDTSGERVVRVPRELETGTRVVLGDLPPMVTNVTSRAVETPRGRAVGVVGFNVWMTAANDPVARAIDQYRGANGIVIDLRGNPGGLAAMIQGVAGHFFTAPAVLGRMKTRTSDLEFRANPRTVTPDGVRVDPYAGPVAILVDELTVSASECFAGGMQSLGRARIFGRQTMGQALPAVTKRLPNGDLLMYAVGDFVTSTGARLEGVGVVPDEVVPLSIEALRAGRDATLDAALRWIDQS